jgi:hypothetical protein
MRRLLGCTLTLGLGLCSSMGAIAQPKIPLIAQAQPPYNCLTREVWSAEKKAWCATHGQSQPVPEQPAPSALPGTPASAPTAPKPTTPSSAHPWHNCLTREVWSAEKQAWCNQMQQLQNAVYQVPDLGTVRLVNGRFNDTTKKVSIALINQPGMTVFADLNRDGRKDAVALLSVTIGRSSVLTYVAAAWNDTGVLKPVDPMFLGDRVKVNSLRVKGDRVTLSFTQPSTGTASSPAQSLTKTYALLMSPLLVPVRK